MISIGAITALLTAHFVGDFLFQSDWMAVNKSKNWWALTVHVLFYSLCFLWAGREFTAITAALHFITDAITSRITSKLWFVDHLSKPEENDGRFVARYNPNRHGFFVMIGFDQLIHFVTLILTYSYVG